MKKIACELCGSNEFVKEDGMFVCQSCGTKYTLEEAKKLMIEGTVEVTGTVQVDNKAKVNNLLILARRAKEMNDSKTAAQYYQQLLLEDPDNWEAAFYTIFYDAHDNKIAQIGAAANRVGNSIPSVFSQIHLLPEEEKQAAAEEVIVQCRQFADMLLSNALDFLKNNYDVQLRETNNPLKDISDYLERRKRMMTQASEWIAPILFMMLKLGDEAKSALPEQPECYCGVYAAARRIVETLFEKQIMNRDIEERKDTTVVAMQLVGASDLLQACLATFDRMDAVAQLEAQLKQQRMDAYWAEHAEEKAQLTEKKQALEQKMQQVKGLLDAVSSQLQALDPNQAIAVPAFDELKELQQQKNELTHRLGSLGLFKGKEKKQIMEQMEALNDRLQECNTKVNNQIAQKKREMQNQRQVLLDEQRELEVQKEALRNQLTEIETELTKER